MKSRTFDDYNKAIAFCNRVNGQIVQCTARKGTEDDRCSLVMEFCGDEGFMIHTPPNRALIPTGRICNLEHLAIQMQRNVSIMESD